LHFAFVVGVGVVCGKHKILQRATATLNYSNQKRSHFIVKANARELSSVEDKSKGVNGQIV